MEERRATTRDAHGRRSNDVAVTHGVEAFKVRLLWLWDESCARPRLVPLLLLFSQAGELGGKSVVDLEPAGVVAAVALVMHGDEPASDPVGDDV